MSASKKIIFTARRSLIALAVALTLAVGVSVGANYLTEQAKNQQRVFLQQEVQDESSLQQKQADLTSLKDGITEFQTLLEQGVVGMADREGWVEQLVASRERMGLPNTLTYTLQPPKPLAQLGVETSVAPAESGAVAAAADGPQFHDLDFQVSGIHEGELLAFLSAYQSQVKGRFRVNECSLTDPLENGLSASCTLRFFTLPGHSAKAVQP